MVNTNGTMKLPGDCSTIVVSAVLGLILFPVPKTLGTCPPDAPERAIQCVARISGTTRQTGSSLLSDWDFKKIEKACEDGEFREGIRCAERIVDSCKDDPDQAVYLNKYLNVPLMKQGVNHLCTRTITEFSGDSDCIREQKPLVKTCADAELKKFINKVNQLDGDPDETKDAACRFMHKVFECQAKSVGTNCGERPADELTKVISYFVPPYCAKSVADEFGNGGADAAHFRLLTTFLCITATVITAMWLS